MKRSPWLVQRIEAPRTYVPEGTQSLAGYYRQSPTPELKEAYKSAIAALNALLPLDYMGSAEFEFGEVGKSLRRQSNEHTDMVKFTVDLTGKPCAYRENDTHNFPATTVTVYGWCHAGDEQSVKDFLIAEAAGCGANYHLKERSHVQDACFGYVSGVLGRKEPLELKTTRVVGWMDLHNDWTASIIKTQINQLAYLLGIPLAHD